MNRILTPVLSILLVSLYLFPDSDLALYTPSFFQIWEYVWIDNMLRP